MNRGASTRYRIIANAKQLISKHGYASTSIVNIAESSSLQKASIYHHFESKDALVAAVLEGLVADLAKLKPFDRDIQKVQVQIEQHLNQNLMFINQLCLSLIDRQSLWQPLHRYKAHLQQLIGEFLAYSAGSSAGQGASPAGRAFAIVAQNLIINMIGKLGWHSPALSLPILSLDVPSITQMTTSSDCTKH